MFFFTVLSKANFCRYDQNFMKRLLRSLLHGFVIFFTFCTASRAEEKTESAVLFKGQLSASYVGSDNAGSWKSLALLRYLPELSAEGGFSNGYSWDLDLSLNLQSRYQSHPSSDLDGSVQLYRLYGELKTSRSDLRIGLQKIDFGPSLILRSLRWFDQIDPTDPLAITNGVYALRYRYFFMNNANVWVWGLYGNGNPKGFEVVGTRKHTPELGGRLQFPIPIGELGLSVHARKTGSFGYTGAFAGDFLEKRLAIDGRFDLGAGLWYEYVLVHQGGPAGSANNWYQSLTLGGDYTVEIGNGLHLIVEHLSVGLDANAFGWGTSGHTTVLQLSYPLTLLDSLSLLEGYSWSAKRLLHYLRWSRTYDNFSLNLGLFAFPTLSGNTGGISFSGTGVQAVVAFYH
ncbi:MAG: hypothetical protein KDD51_05030 [Bdellovibrionales bacterium]|nr:hypothetical protein [Bdellovibrionales bacterium]